MVALRKQLICAAMFSTPLLSDGKSLPTRAKMISQTSGVSNPARFDYCFAEVGR
jgi:hypothetical protein